MPDALTSIARPIAACRAAARPAAARARTATGAPLAAAALTATDFVPVR
ncbi:hypothetical protein [Sphingomonas sp.]